MVKDLPQKVQGKISELYDTQIYANYMIFPGNVPIYEIYEIYTLTKKQAEI